MGKRSEKKWQINRGITMVELLVAMVAAFLVFIGIGRLFLGSTRSFARAENMMQLRANLDMVLDKVSEEFMQAGADLPDSFPAVTPTSTSDVRVIANRSAAVHTFVTACTANVHPRTIKIDNANGFCRSPALAHVIRRSGSTDISLALNTSYNSAPWIAGVDTVGDSLCFANNVVFQRGDMIFVADTFRYYHDPLSKQLRVVQRGSASADSVYARNVETFYIAFFNKVGATVTTWRDMRVCSLFVQVRAEKPERGVGGDGYRRVSGYKRFYLRNREF